ncbi:hypothetical protein, partial [Mitsuaria sp. GD03876]|uniref:hypothetical protein n=1 Tax=Mitsuaria sp. GD03876 TaxID=2975399 RepID=UPI00244CF47E
MTRPHRFPRAPWLLALAGGLATTTHAEDFNAVDRISLAAGVYHVRPTVSARGATPDGASSISSFSGQDANLPRLTLDFRLFESQGFSFDYYRYQRTDGFSAFDTDSQLSTRLEFGKAAYKWWLGSGDVAFSVGAGASYYKASTRTRAVVTGADGSRTSLDVKGSGGQLAPFGEVGLRYAFGPDLRLFADASGAWKSSGGRRVSIYNTTVGVEWFPLRNVGVVASYNLSDFKLKNHDDINSFLNL